MRPSTVNPNGPVKLLDRECTSESYLSGNVTKYDQPKGMLRWEA